MLQNEVPEAINVAAAQLAKDCRVRVILNAATALFVSTPADQKKAVTSDEVIRFLSERR
jgi:hypothetical protein